MNADFYLCDVCKAMTNNRLFIPTGRQMDAAGSTEEVGESVDLCESHLLLLLLLMFKGNYENGKEAIGWIKKWRKER